MSNITIHVTKKLEKQISKFIGSGEVADPSPLGKWNATVFYVDRKKCWLVTNKLTQYNLILADITAKKLKDINQIFSDTFYEQLVYDGIIVHHEKVNKLVGQLAFRPTDNDRRTLGFQKQRLFTLEWHKFDYNSLDEMPIRKLNHHMNGSPIHLDPNRKRLSDYTSSAHEMKQLLEKLS